MSTVKISQLEDFSILNPSTDDNIFVTVDLISGITGKVTGTVIADGLYSNNPLKVGNNQILFPRTVAQFSGDSEIYFQVNLQNFNANGSVDYVATSDNGTNFTGFVDYGITNSNYYDVGTPFIFANDGYLYTKGTNALNGNLIIGTATGNANVIFMAGGYDSNDDIVFVLSKKGLNINQNKVITFYDGTTISTSPNAIISQANTFLQSNDYLTWTRSQSYTDTANTFLQANDYLTWTRSQSYTDTANTFLQSNDYLTWTSSQSYTDAANTWLYGQILTITSNTSNSGLELSYLYTNTTVSQANTFLQANDALTLTASKTYTDQANTWLQANFAGENSAISQANTFLQANDALTLTASKTYTDQANTWLQANFAGENSAISQANTFLQANDYLTLTTSKTYTDQANTYGNSTYFKYSNTDVVFASNVTVPGVLTTNTSSLICIAGLTAANTIPNGIDITLPLVSQYDPNGWWNSTANTLTPTVAGWYQVNAQVWWGYAGGTDPGQINNQVRKNTNTVVIGQDAINHAFAAGKTISLTSIVYLNGSTDFLDLTAYTANSGGQVVSGGTITAGGSSSGTFLQVYFIR